MRPEVCGNNYLFAFYLFLGLFLIKKNEEYSTEIEKKTFYIVSEYNVGGGGLQLEEKLG